MTAKKSLRYLSVPVLLMVLILYPPLEANSKSSPLLNDGRKWRIGYYEGGPYSDYTDTMRTLVDGLMESGWIEKTDPPRIEGDIPKPYWGWLGKCESPYLSFQALDGYSADWDDAKRTDIKAALMERLKKKELDLVIAMGTWAGQDLANDDHSVPTMVLSTSDPIRAGIVRSATDSGYDHLTARVDPTRYLRQLRMFHRLVGFKTLGVAVEDGPDGPVYSALEDVKAIAGERGFTVVTCLVKETGADLEERNRSCLDCYRNLARKADAVYVTALTCLDRLSSEVASLLLSQKTPSFSMIGSKYVKQGLMFSISSDSGYKELGRYNASKLSKILSGTKPRILKQVFEDPLDVAVNMNTIEKIGFEMPPSILRIATEVYGR